MKSQSRVLYSIAEAAQILGISKSTAHELVIRGDLPAVHLGARRLITPGVLEELLGERPPPPSSLINSTV